MDNNLKTFNQPFLNSVIVNLSLLWFVPLVEAHLIPSSSAFQEHFVYERRYFTRTSCWLFHSQWCLINPLSLRIPDYDPSRVLCRFYVKTLLEAVLFLAPIQKNQKGKNLSGLFIPLAASPLVFASFSRLHHSLRRARSLTNRQLRRLGLLKFFVVPNKFRGENATFKAWTGAEADGVDFQPARRESFFLPSTLLIRTRI